MKFLTKILAFFLFNTNLLAEDKFDSLVTMIFTGDLTFARAFENSYNRKKFDVFANWSTVGSYDAMMVNLENAVTRSTDSIEKEFVFKMRPELLSILKTAKINLVNCANNHTADFGIEGILETMKYLDSAGIKYVGVGRNFREARKPVILEKNGIKIGFLGYGGVKDFIAMRNRAGTNSRNEKLILEDIIRLRPDVDYVVVNLHWGEELATEPHETQISLAHKMIDNGADLIVGHHPHVLQGIEKYNEKVIAYSLGNFIFGGNSRARESETAVLKVNFSKKYMEVQVIPVYINNWRPELAGGIRANRVIKMIKDRSKIFGESILFQSLGEENE